MCDDFTLYIFCFDDKSYEILKEKEFKHSVIIHHREFETAELLEVKKKDRNQNIVGPVLLLL
ncbi:hypothetical protein DFH76_004388 [Clostridium beijerinckii]|nr:hypothetical protein [Clostridium beijerinckii]